MKKLCFLLLLALFSPLLAEVSKVHGGGSYAREELESIQAAGLIKLNGTKVQNEVQVQGSLISHNGEIGSLNIMGEANLTRTIVKDGGSVIGSFQMTHSKIEKPITLLTHKAVLSNSQLMGITVKQNVGFKGKQVLELRNRTLVDGPIHFESGKGEVLLYSGSQVLGPVSGGKVIRR